jgi:hypothetical protein
MAKTLQITVDCADPAALSDFWAEVLGYQHDDPPEGFDSWEAALDAWGVPVDRRNSSNAVSDPDGVGPRLFFQQVPEGKTAKNRMHIDVRSAPGLIGDERMARLEQECARLVALGATRQQRFEPQVGLSHGFIVMADLEGNEFCLD